MKKILFLMLLPLSTLAKEKCVDPNEYAIEGPGAVTRPELWLRSLNDDTQEFKSEGKTAFPDKDYDALGAVKRDALGYFKQAQREGKYFCFDEEKGLYSASAPTKALPYEGRPVENMKQARAEIRKLRHENVGLKEQLNTCQSRTGMSVESGKDGH